MRIRHIGWLTGLAVGLASAGFADATLYAGQPTENAGITLRSWGAGSIEDSTETTFVGSRSIKVLTRGTLSGGWVVFNTPVDLRADVNAPDKAMRFTLRFAGTSGGAMGGGAGGPQAPGGLGGPGGAPRGGPGFGGGAACLAKAAVRKRQADSADQARLQAAGKPSRPPCANCA